MQPFTAHTGLVAPLDRSDVDTDQIVPKQFLKRVERAGFGEFLFHDWRRTAEGALDPAFPLNDARYRGASVLVAGRNFGCGSSREHAPWALQDFGFRAIVAPSFAEIFATNCAKIGLVAAAVPEGVAAAVAARAKRPEPYELTVDLERSSIWDGEGLESRFEIDAFARSCLLEGLDEIGLTLQFADDIARFEAGRAPATPRERARG